MPRAEYWDGDPAAVREYRAAHEQRQRRKNEELWLQGLYFYEALLDASPLLRAFVKNGTKAHPYLEEPFPRSEKEIRERAEREERKQYELTKQRFLENANRLNAAKKAAKEAKPDGGGTDR